MTHHMPRPDSIAVGDWSFDEHMTGKYAVPDSTVKSGYSVMLEGNFWPSVQAGCPASGADGIDFHAGGNSTVGDGRAANTNAYDVPYKIMTPKRGTGGNLLVPVALSASAVAYSSTRIESMFMYVGTAAGVAAKQLVDGTAPTVQDVNVTKVQVLLQNKFNQIIHVPAPSPPPVPPAQVPAFYTVSGAGTAVWNGRYTRVKNTLTFASDSCSNCSIYANNQGIWRLATLGTLSVSRTVCFICV